MIDNENRGQRFHYVFMGAILVAGLLVAALIMWADQKAEEVARHNEAREAAAAAKP